MKNEKEIKEKLAGARSLYAGCARIARQLASPEAAAEAAKFFASIRVLEWVIEHDREEVTNDNGL